MVKRKRTNNGQEKKDKQWSREKGQTMVKRKRTNNGQEKKDKQRPRIKRINTINQSNSDVYPVPSYWYLLDLYLVKFSSSTILSGAHVTRSLVLCVCLSFRTFSFWPLCCLFFFDIRILITSLISSNSSYQELHIRLYRIQC